MTSLLGLHWIRTHPEGRDLQHIERMQYPSVKLFEWHWSNRDACRDLLTVLPKDAYILARDHPLSEQPIWGDPVGIGTRHANEWAMKVAEGRVHVPTDRTFFLGRNEPDATTGDRNAIDLYTSTFLARLRVHGLRGGAFNFSTGHPRTVDGTGGTLADYSVFERSHQAIVAGHHIGVLHIYGTAAQPCTPGHFDRLKACPWQDVEWIVGELGADEHVVGGGKHDGYLISMADNPARYCAWLDTLILGIDDPRIHSYQVFSYDYSHPWSSFDTRPIRDALESYDWRHTKRQPAPTPTTPPTVVTHLPTIQAGSGKVPALAHPIQDPAKRVISQRFGENPEEYERFGLAGHTGIDFAVPEGTVVCAVDAGVVLEAGELPDYGTYIKLRHPWGESVYAHLSKIRVTHGEPVGAGEPIALSGNTGNSTGPHLHFAVRVYPYQRGAPYDGYSDPAPYLLHVPPPTQSIPALIKEAAKEFGLEWQLVAALAWAESSFNPRAESKAGAKGLMQLMPATWAEWSAKVGGTDIFDPSQNLHVGTAYLAWLLSYFKGDAYKAVLAYNLGIGNVIAGVRPPEDTVAYVERVLMGRDLLKALAS